MQDRWAGRAIQECAPRSEDGETEARGGWSQAAQQEGSEGAPGPSPTLPVQCDSAHTRVPRIRDASLRLHMNMGVHLLP